MNEREMTAEEMQNFEAEVVHQGHGGTSDESAASHPDGPVTQDEFLAPSGVEPAIPQRRTRTRSQGPARRRGEDFNPTSRGDENGEVM